jgi:hypothetical protein
VRRPPHDGELVYRGPNVMLGYAHGAADLALGRTTGELRTGDLARRTPEGLYEVVGRKNRFLKLFGLRIDLDRVERVLAEEGVAAACAGTDDVLVVAVRGAVRRVDRLVRARFGLPGASVRVVRVREFPRLANGKVDYAAVVGLGRPATVVDGSVRQVFASALGVADVPDDATFVDLGGDSLSYVQTSVALERVLGPLPENWPTTPVAELEERRAPVSRTPSVETNIVLRALAIVLVVGSHIEVFDITGGAHLLLVIAGWNFARFVLPAPVRMVRSAALIAAPAVVWLAYRVAVTDDVTVVNVLLVNNFVGGGAIGYWFVEVVVHALVAFAALFAVPAVRRFERAHGFVTALVLLGAALLPRVGFDASSSFAERNMTTLGALWFFVLGWLVQRAETRWQKVVVLVLALALIPGTFDDRAREAVVVVGLVLLVVVARVWLPRAAVTAVTLVASASLYIYLTHYAVFPALLDHLPRSLVAVSSLAAGIVVWQAVRRYQRTATRWYRRAFPR